MASVQFVTLVVSGGTPVRISDQKGAPYPTTGQGSLVFANGAELVNPEITSPIWIGPQTIEGNFVVRGNLTVGGSVAVAGDFNFDGSITVQADLEVFGHITARDDVIFIGSASGMVALEAPAVATGTVVLPSAGGTLALKGAVVAKTTNYVILAADDSKIFTTEGAGASVTFTLPTAVAGMSFTFIVAAAFPLVVDAPASVTIAIGESITSAGGTMSADGGSGGLYSVLGLTAISSTLWVATTSFGPWSPT